MVDRPRDGAQPTVGKLEDVQNCHGPIVSALAGWGAACRNRSHDIERVSVRNTVYPKLRCELAHRPLYTQFGQL